MAILNNDQANFVIQVSKATEIDPRVIIAWMYQEGAYKPNGTGGWNYLNLRPFAGDNHKSVSPGGFAQFASDQDAITATIAAIRQPQFSPILATAKAKPTPAEQIAAIAGTQWDGNDHYGGKGGVLLQNAIEHLFGGKAVLTDHYVGPAQAQPISNEVGGNASDWTSIDMTSAASGAAGAVGSAAHAIAAPFESVAAAWNWLGHNWARVLLFVGGLIAVIIGGFFVFKSQAGDQAAAMAKFVAL
jgi:hypothetical protein